MQSILDLIFRRKKCDPLWSSTDPVREELFGVERLEKHATSLAKAQQVAKHAPRVMCLRKRVDENATALLNAYQDSAAEIARGSVVVPAAEWLLDNYHLVEQQIREVRDDLPAHYYRQLPKLLNGPFKGYPRVFGLAWAYVAHTDSLVEQESLIRFIRAYQKVQPLTIGELWAVAITLRIVLIENLRRLADQISFGRAQREEADRLTQTLLETQSTQATFQAEIENRSTQPLSLVFASQLAKRLRDQDPKTTPALEWLTLRLSKQQLTIDKIVKLEQQRQGASNVSIRNVITSMRLISDIDWADLFEAVSLVDQQLNQNTLFSAMDFATRSLYRSAVEQLARGCNYDEVEIAKRVIEMAKKSAATPSDCLGEEQQIERTRIQEPGNYLIGEGRLSFEKSIDYKPTIRLFMRRLHLRLGVTGYIASVAGLALVILSSVFLYAEFLTLSTTQLILWFVIGFIPATEAATTIVNRLVTWQFGSMTLPALALKSGVPSSLRTLIVIPTLLTNKAQLLEQIERLEVHYLSGIEGDVSFALLTDGLDAEQQSLASDEVLLTLVSNKIKALNEQYTKGENSARFLLLHRKRLFNAQENTWMGWERKRGKLQELNRLLRGATDTSYIAVNGVQPNVPEGVRYVITLDGDTRLPRESALRLIGKMAHPLNRPRFDSNKQRVVAGYGILQPRVTPSLSIGSEGSIYQRTFSAPGGIDPYTAAVSDVYQDLFGEGSFTGKGIYDVDTFNATQGNRVAENTMLSHDLFEGIFARAGLVSDIEVVEEFPARYDEAQKRQHRWIRGDWQLLPWIFSKFSDKRAVNYLGRLKLVDNLRRSLVAPATILAFGLCWLLPFPLAMISTMLLLSSIAIPSFIFCLFSIIPHHSGIDPQSHLRRWLEDLQLALNQTLLSIVFLADQSWRTIDAIMRSLSRLLITHKNCLEWTTAAHCSCESRLEFGGFYRTMLPSLLMVTVILSGVLILNPAIWVIALPFAITWFLAPAIAYWVSRAPALIHIKKLSENETLLRHTARRTWRYFETFVSVSDNMLPPDNFQEQPKAVIAHRTSPTNIGLYLLSCIAARDFGWAGRVETIERLEATFITLHKLIKHKGHLFNWYDTQTLMPLLPEYVSSVDSGNLAGHLITLANSCDELKVTPASDYIRAGLLDNIQLARQALISNKLIMPTEPQASQVSVLADPDLKTQLMTLIDDIENAIVSAQTLESELPSLITLTHQATHLAVELSGQIKQEKHHKAAAEAPIDLFYWLNALSNLLMQQQIDNALCEQQTNELNTRITTLSNAARTMAMAMDFSFLVDPQRKLLAIGFSLTENSLETSCYDLLASEARLASLFAIAKGDIATKHWFRLGRTSTPMGKGSALISWSGSMFEYLMPSLIMRAPAGSLLAQTNQLIVKCQQEYADKLGIPWGISESGYNARDIEFTYQYSNFGVPGLGLKRGLADNTVIAPYATGLAAMVNPQAAVDNFKRLNEMGACARFGFYEALDFTPSRLPLESTFALVKSYMAHHQGMTIVSIANTLNNSQFRQRFHQEPMIKACELLLQERVPRDVSTSHPRAEKVNVSSSLLNSNTPKVRYLNTAEQGPPMTHILSNGHYSVMLTPTGAGYSHWRDTAITRWQEDVTCNNYGSFIFLKDINSGKLWTNGAQPLGCEGHHTSAEFAEDHAQFIHHDASFTTITDILVSGEDDSEVRRVSLNNNGHNERDIELTSYFELVLSSAKADNAHPAFNKMFVQTEYLEQYNALIATRRTREEHEPEIWVAHFAVVEGEVCEPVQYETDRALFIGRGNTLADATALTHHGARQTAKNSAINEYEYASKALSNSVGTVLDPIFSLRCRVHVKSGDVVRVAFWTMVASSKTQLIDLIDRHHDRNAYERAKTLAWTQAQVQLRHFAISASEAADFQHLSAPILYADLRFRAPEAVIQRGVESQSMLWTYSVSGDLPIVLMHIDDVQDIPQVKQLLRAQEYWRMKCLHVDIVIINEHVGSYRQELQTVLETAVRSIQPSDNFNAGFDTQSVQGTVHILRADLITVQAAELLKSIARVVLIAHRGTIAEQLVFIPKPHVWNRQAHPGLKLASSSTNVSGEVLLTLLKNSLEFFNGIGGFSDDGRQYTIILKSGLSTPAPWINVIANAQFGFHVAAEGGGYTWSENSRENKLTPWSNDPVSNPSGEAIYIRDEDTFQLFTATASPLKHHATNQDAFITHHGFGYSRFEHQADKLSLSLLQYVPLDDPIKISRLTLHNKSSSRRRLRITHYTEWVLGINRSESAASITCELDAKTNAIFIQNRWNTAFGNRVAFTDLNAMQTQWTSDRTEFLGCNGNMSSPAALLCNTPLSKKLGAGHDPCTAQQCVIELAPGESKEIVAFIGQCASAQEASELISRFRKIDLNSVFDEVTSHWHKTLHAVQVKTPDRAMDIMLNGWLLYQTIACRMWARSAFYQSSGAYGFRDQLQDSLALTFASPALSRAHIIRAAGRQFIQGDVQHWWLPHSGQGVRTRISDDKIWLAYTTAKYVLTSGDNSILDEKIAFIDGPILTDEQHETYFQAKTSDSAASLFEHCMRSIEHGIAQTGEHGLPLIGTGDWNDGMNRVGAKGKGESVWLGWFLISAIELFLPLLKARADEPTTSQSSTANESSPVITNMQRAANLEDYVDTLKHNIEAHAWDGQWYRRASFDDGSWIGAKPNKECKIDSIAQSWAVLSKAANSKRSKTAMAAVDKHLTLDKEPLVLLFTPPFINSQPDPGYIKSYPAGLRENGGQYSHAAMWLILAHTQLGYGNKAHDLFCMLNPINYSSNKEKAYKYKVEPYVLAADVYSVAPHCGRGGWTWYTGAASWMYRAAMEGILGIYREGSILIVNPCIPSDWSDFEAKVNVENTQYAITVHQSGGAAKKVISGELDGKLLALCDGLIRAPLDQKAHALNVVIKLEKT